LNIGLSKFNCGFICIKCTGNSFQVKMSDDPLKEVTHRVYFDIEIDGKPAGM